MLTGAIGLTLFAIAPAADTGRGPVRSDAYPVLDTTALVDQYATLPGLHVALNLLITLAVLAATRRTWSVWWRWHSRCPWTPRSC